MARRKRSASVGGIRSFLYTLARLLGDVNTVQRGRVGRRIVRRAAGKGSGRAMRKLFR